MSASIPNHYVLLNIDPKADDAAIRRAYHRIALANHPDKTLGLPAAERERKATVFKQAAAAYECLLDHTKRRNYDYTLPRARPSYTAPPRSTPAPTPGREQQSGFKRPGASGYTQPSKRETQPPPPPRQPPQQPPKTKPRPFQAPRFFHPFRNPACKAPPPSRPDAQFKPQPFPNVYAFKAGGGGMPNTSPSQNPNPAAKPGVGGKPRPNNGTASPPFYAYTETEGPGNATAHYQTITAQYAYQSYSLEELRVADYLQNRRFSSPQGNKHAFTAGTAPSGATSSPWFYAPVTESLSHTTLTFSNSCGWNFSVSTSRSCTWTHAPILPYRGADTAGEITVKIPLQRAGVRTYKDVDVMVNVKSTPGFRSTALSSIVVERASDSGIIELQITLATASGPPSLVPAPSWIWAFDADMGYLIPFYNIMRATQLIFYPSYPSHAVPQRIPHPEGSPQAMLTRLYPGIRFGNMSEHSYCAEVEWGGRKLWRLLAVGSM
jgi:hypothetical protein